MNLERRLLAPCGCEYNLIEDYSSRDGKFTSVQVSDRRCEKHRFSSEYFVNVDIAKMTGKHRKLEPILNRRDASTLYDIQRLIESFTDREIRDSDACSLEIEYAKEDGRISLKRVIISEGAMDEKKTGNRPLPDYMSSVTMEKTERGWAVKEYPRDRSETSQEPVSRS